MDDQTLTSYQNMELDYPTGKECHADVKKYYDDWSKTYDTDMKNLGNGDPEEISEYVFCNIISECDGDVLHDYKILDVGAGTGKVGYELKKRGFSGSIYGVDYSQGMVDNIPPNIYKDVLIHVIEPGKPLPYGEMKFDLVTVAGTFGPNTMSYKCIFDIIKCTKTNGYVIITTRKNYEKADDFYPQLEATFKNAEESEKWTKIIKKDFSHYAWKINTNGLHTNKEPYVMKGLIHVYKVL